MAKVEKAFDCNYDSRASVEKYFLKLQEAWENSKLLDQPFTEKQIINKALTKFEKRHCKDAHKAEKRWYGY